ncbi:MAG: cobaltochelatase subunit CobN [Euryarchaeota archaeon]
MTTFVFSLLLCGAVFAEENTLEGDPGGTEIDNFSQSADELEEYDDPQMQSAESSGELVDPKVLIIHSSTSTKMTNDAARQIMDLINPTQQGYNPQDPSTWLVTFEVRTTTQIGEMSPEDLKKLIEDADIIISQWLFEPGLSNFRNVIDNNPEILTNKPNKMFIVLESQPELTKISQIGGNLLFEGIPDAVIGDTNTQNTILLDLKNTNIARLNNYKNTYPQLAPWIDLGFYYTSKGTVNYVNQYKLALKIFTQLNGGSWPSSWDPEPYITLPKETLYRGGEIFLTLEEYLNKYPYDPSKPTVGIVELDSPMIAGNMDHFESLIDQLISKGFNVIPVVGAYSGKVGNLPLNIYSAMVKFFVYDANVDTRATATSVVQSTAYEAKPQNYSYRLDALISLYYFSLGSGYVDETNKLLEYMNVPVFRAITSTKRSEGEWLASDDGLLWSDTYYQIAIPETQGIIEPIFISTTENEKDLLTGANLITYKAIPERIEKLVNRVYNWTQLKYLANSDKKIALVYYNYPPGKSTIGASYLAVPDSILMILNQLKSEGYAVEDIPADADQLLEIMFERGINVANWAPGVLEEMANNPHVILWDVQEYEAWFATLHPVARKQVEEGPVGYIEEITKIGLDYYQNRGDETARDAALKTVETWTAEMLSLAETYPEKATHSIQYILSMSTALKNILNNVNPEASWIAFYNAKNDFMALEIPGMGGWGAAPGNIMTVKKDGKDYIVIPGIYFGNIFIGPEPQRGWEGDASKFYHSTIVPPPHNYLAWYAWVNNQFGANAQIHLGRHATFEWLPRKQVALASFDYPDIMVGNTPSIYIYIVDGVGEGMQAKRRGLSVIISHLTPPMKMMTTLYGEFVELKGLVDDYEKTLDENPLKEEYKQGIKDLIKKMNLQADLGIDNVDQLTDDDIDHLHEYLMVLQQTIMPFGLHTFGQSWEDSEIVMLATTMVSADGGTADPSLHRLLAQQKGWDYDNLSLDQAEELINLAQQWIYDIFTGTKTPVDLTANAQLQDKLTQAVNYAHTIKFSFTNELDALLTALNGGYISPSSGNDPIRNPDAIPTGRNFYALAENQMPTKVAWALGKKLADMALSQLDTLPEKVAAVVWCVETSRDDGTMVSFVLRMLGIEPTWLSSGSVSRMVATPLETLLNDLNAVRAAKGLAPFNVRPRIDVVVTTSGLFRDLFPRLLVNIDRSYRVALAASYNTIVAEYPELKQSLDYTLETLVAASYTNFKRSDPISQNNIARNWIELSLLYISQGLSAEEAGEFAITRIFAPPVGDYGAGVNKPIGQPWTWETRDEVADVYINRMSNAYSERNWGESYPDLFKELLKGIDTAYHSRSTNLYGVFDNDDYFDYFGGLSMAIERVNGQAPNLNVLYYANPSHPQVTPLQQFMLRELRTRYFNPQWIEGMMKEGYSGARQISQKFAENLWGWQVTNPNLIDGWMWDELVDIYIYDKYNIGVTEWLSSGNQVYPMISLQGTMLTAAHKINDGTGSPYWQANPETIRQVANSWAQMIAQHGVTCDHHVCGDMQMVEWAMQYIDADIASQFREEMYRATKNAMFAPGGSDPGVTPGTPGTTPGTPGTTPSAPSSTASSGHSHDVSAEAAQESASDSAEAGEEGGKSYEVSTADSASSSQDNSMIYTIIGIISVLALVGAGFYFGPGRRS